MRKFNIAALILLFLGIMSVFIILPNDEFGLGVLLISFPLVVISLLLFSFNLVIYFREKNKALGNWIFGLLLAFLSIIFIISTIGLFDIQPFGRWDIAGWFLYPLQIVIIIILIVYEFQLNKK